MWNIRICFLLRGERGYFTKKFFSPKSAFSNPKLCYREEHYMCITLCVYVCVYIQAFDIALRIL